MSMMNFHWNASIKDDYELTIHRLFRLLHQRNRYVGREPTVNLSLVEAHILIELDATPDLSQRALCTLLDVTQPMMSALCNTLKGKRWISAHSDPSDKRIKRYRLTAEGNRVVRSIDELADHTFSLFAKDFSSSEKKSLIEFFRAIADGYGQPAGNLRKNEPPFRLQQRRITRAFSLLSDKVFGSELSPIEWQIAAEIALRSGEGIARELESRLHLSPSTLSSALNRFETLGLIDRSTTKSDLRVRKLKLTKAGFDMVQRVESLAANGLRSALSGHSRTAVRKGMNLLSRYTIGERAADSDQLLDFRVAHGKVEKQQARAFIIDNAENNNGRFYPATLAGAESMTVVARVEGEIVAVYDMEWNEGGLAIVSAGWIQAPTLAHLVEWLCRSPDGPRIEIAPTIEFVPLKDLS